MKTSSLLLPLVVLLTFFGTSCENYEDQYQQALAENNALQQKVRSLEEEDKLIRG